MAMGTTNEFRGTVTITAFLAAALLAATGCGSDPGTDTGTGPEAKLDSAAKIEGFLEDKPLVMAGDDIPTHPNGYLRDVNLAQATQCYSEVNMALKGSNFDVKSKLGTLMNAPNTGDVGKCDESTVSRELEFNSTTYLVENIEGDAECFDITITYTGFGQEGRGAISEDRKELHLELYFKDKAANMRCADGKPGAKGVQLDGKPFDGDAVQVYQIAD
jgi:hypothetical protein